MMYIHARYKFGGAREGQCSRAEVAPSWIFLQPGCARAAPTSVSRLSSRCQRNSLQQLLCAVNKHAAALQFDQLVAFRRNAARVAKFEQRSASGADAAAAAAAVIVVNAPVSQAACKCWSANASVAAKYNRRKPERAAAMLQLPLPVSCAASWREGAALCGRSGSEVLRVEGRNKAALAVSVHATPAQHARHLTCAQPPAGQQQQKQQQQKQPEHCRRPIPSRKVPRNRGGWRLLRTPGLKTNCSPVCFGGLVPMQS
jgi:hypothetical protein